MKSDIKKGGERGTKSTRVFGHRIKMAKFIAHRVFYAMRYKFRLCVKPSQNLVYFCTFVLFIL